MKKEYEEWKEELGPAKHEVYENFDKNEVKSMLKHAACQKRMDNKY